jgi:hypothetical protein
VAETFDPIAILRELEQRRVPFVVIGHMAEVANGSPLGFDEVEITFQVRDEAIQRLRATVESLGGDAGAVERVRELGEGASVAVETPHGELRLTPLPPGTSGWDDLRRKSERLHLARGLRASVAGVRDLIRMQNAGDADRVRVATLQRIEALDRGIGLEFTP